jgi:hypothetical protein
VDIHGTQQLRLDSKLICMRTNPAVGDLSTLFDDLSCTESADKKKEARKTANIAERARELQLARAWDSSALDRHSRTLTKS